MSNWLKNNKLYNKLMSNKLFVQIFKFGLVGGIAFLIDFGVLVFCVEVLKLNVTLSGTISFTVSVIFNYIASVKWVFDVDKDKSKKRNFIIFIIFSVIGLLINDAILYIGDTKLHLYYVFVKIFATAVVMVFNFVTRKMFLEKKN